MPLNEFVNNYSAGSMLQFLPVSILITNTKGVIEDTNEEFLKETGYQQKDIANKNLLDFLEFPESTLANPIGEQPLENILNNRHLFFKDYKGVLKSVSLKSRAIEENGNDLIIHALEFNLKQKLKSFNEYLFEADKTPKIIYDFGNLEILRVNPAAVKHYGYEREEFESLTILDLRPKEYIPEILELWKNLDENLVEQNLGSFIHLKKNGSQIKVEVTGSKILYQNKTCIEACCNDVTKREEEESKLKKIDESFKYITKTTFDAIWEWNVDLGMVIRGQGFTDAFGIQPADLAESKWDLLAYVSSKHKDLILKEIDDILNSKIDKWEFEYNIVNPEGNTFLVQDRAFIIRKANQPVRVIGTIKDISHHRYYTALNDLELQILTDNALGNLPLSQLIDKYIKGIEELHPEMICSLTGISNDKLYTISAPSIPREFLEKVKGINIGQNVGSCGAAAYLKKTIIVTNVEEDPRWQPYLFLQKYFHFKACWSHPIKDHNETVQATFACYYPFVAAPSKLEQNTINRASHILNILLQSNHWKENLKLSNDRYELATRATSEAIWEWEVDNEKVFIRDRSLNLNQSKDAETYNIHTALKKIHPDDRQNFITNLKKVLEGNKNNWQFGHRFLIDKNSYAYINNQSIIVRNSDGDAVKVVGAMQDITEKKIERDRLKLMESVITNANDAIVITDPGQGKFSDPIIVYANAAYCRMTGYEFQELKGNPYSIVHGPKTDKQELKRINSSLRHNSAIESTQINYKKNGEEFWVNLNISPLINDNGTITHMIAIERDITHKVREQTQKNLFNEISEIFSQQNSLYQSIELSLEKVANLDNLDIVEVWLVDTTETRITLEGAYYETQELRVDFQNFSKIKEGFRKGEGAPGLIWDTNDELWMDEKQVEEKFVRNQTAKKNKIKTIFGFPLKYKGAVKGVILLGTIHEEIKKNNLFTITKSFGEFLGSEIKRKQIELELKQIFNFSLDFICVIGNDGKLKRVNPAMCNALNITEQHLLNKRFSNLVAVEDREVTKNHIENPLRDQTSNYFENRFVMQNGDIKWIGWTISEAYEDGLKFGIGKDITEKKNTQDRLKILNQKLVSRSEKLSKSNRELEQYAYVASHDLQEPLRMVTSFLAKIDEKYSDKLDDKGKTYMEFAVNGANHMRQTILDLLEYSKVSSQNESVESIDVNILISEICIDISEVINNKKGVINYTSLPVIQGHRTALRQIFQNLIMNALKYSRVDIDPVITISTRENSDFWFFCVSDNGLGIKEEYHKTIFQLFQRLHSSQEYPGTGVGLAIVKKLIERLGGEIRIKSVLNQGSEFEFQIPKIPLNLEQ